MYKQTSDQNREETFRSRGRSFWAPLEQWGEFKEKTQCKIPETTFGDVLCNGLSVLLCSFGQWAKHGGCEITIMQCKGHTGGGVLLQVPVQHEAGSRKSSLSNRR